MTGKTHDQNSIKSEHHFTDQSKALQQLLKHAARRLT
jgi:hypothetical protein